MKAVWLAHFRLGVLENKGVLCYLLTGLCWNALWSGFILMGGASLVPGVVLLKSRIIQGNRN